jgi:hypothetical protein
MTGTEGRGESIVAAAQLLDLAVQVTHDIAELAEASPALLALLVRLDLVEAAELQVLGLGLRRQLRLLLGSDLPLFEPALEEGLRIGRQGRQVGPAVAEERGEIELAGGSPGGPGFGVRR